MRLAASLLGLLMIAAACASEPAIDPRFAIATLDDVAEQEAVYLPRHRVYLVDSPTDGLIALSERDPNLGCRIAHLGAAEFRIDNPLVSFDETRFVDPCHGSEYDESGYYLGGPSPRSMDRFPLEVQGNLVFIEPGSSIIEVPRPPESAG